MHKFKSFGFDKPYKIEIYGDWKLNPKARISDRQKRYDKEIIRSTELWEEKVHSWLGFSW